MRYYVGVKSSLNIIVQNASTIRHVLGVCYIVCQDLVSWFYCLLDLSCGECNVISLFVLCCSANGSVCFVRYVSDRVCELIGETIRNMFGCDCYFIVECYGVV